MAVGAGVGACVGEGVVPGDGEAAGTGEGDAVGVGTVRNTAVGVGVRVLGVRSASGEGIGAEVDVGG